MIEIGKMKISEIPEAAAIEKECFSVPWSEESFHSAMKNGNSVFFAAKEQNIVGYAGMNYIIDEGYIYNIAVKKKYRQKGIGQALIDTLLDFSVQQNLKFLSLEVRASNKAAISLYKKNGFEEVSVRKNFYLNPSEDAIIMTKWWGEKRV